MFTQQFQAWGLLVATVTFSATAVVTRARRRRCVGALLAAFVMSALNRLGHRGTPIWLVDIPFGRARFRPLSYISGAGFCVGRRIWPARMARSPPFWRQGPCHIYRIAQHARRAAGPVHQFAHAHLCIWPGFTSSASRYCVLVYPLSRRPNHHLVVRRSTCRRPIGPDKHIEARGVPVTREFPRNSSIKEFSGTR